MNTLTLRLSCVLKLSNANFKADAMNVVFILTRRLTQFSISF